MGRPIADRLNAAGHEVTILVRRPEARVHASAAGLGCADTVAETVRDADAVFSVVLTDDQVRATCLGAGGAIAAMKPGATLVQHTTSDPATAELLAAEGGDHGVAVLDAALSGAPEGVAAGTLTLWVGGDEARLDALRPVLGSYASPIMFVGPHGNGQRVKLVNNALLVANLGLAVDAVRLAGSVGIDEPTILAALQHGSGTSRAFGIVSNSGSVDLLASRVGGLMRKDVSVVRNVALRAGADLGIIGAVLSSDTVEHQVLAPDATS